MAKPLGWDRWTLYDWCRRRNTNWAPGNRQQPHWLDCDYSVIWLISHHTYHVHNKNCLRGITLLLAGSSSHRALRWRHISSLASQITRLLVQQLVNANIKDRIKFPPYWPFVRGIHRRPLVSPHKGPVRRTAWRHHGVCPVAVCAAGVHAVIPTGCVDRISSGICAGSDTSVVTMVCLPNTGHHRSLMTPLRWYYIGLKSVWLQGYDGSLQCKHRKKRHRRFGNFHDDMRWSLLKKLIINDPY